MSNSPKTKQSTGKSALKIKRVIIYIILIMLVFVSLFPFYLLIINSTRGRAQAGIELIPQGEFWGNLKNLFSQKTTTFYGNVFRTLGNSLFIAVFTSAFTVYFSALTAYAIHAYDFKLKKAAHTFILLIMMVPTQASAIGFYRFMDDLSLTNTYIPLIVPAIAAPATYFFMIQYMKSSLPLEIVEASRIDGCGEFKTFNRIILPIMKPAFAVQAIFAFVASWNNFFMPQMILSDKSKFTVPLILAVMRGETEKDLGVINMYIVVAVIPIIIIYLCLSKFIIRGVALGSVKG